MPDKGGIAASVDGQLALSEEEVDAQKMVVIFIVASASAAFSLPLVWQYVTLWVRRQQHLLLPLQKQIKQGSPSASQSAGYFA